MADKLEKNFKSTLASIALLTAPVAAHSASQGQVQQAKFDLDALHPDLKYISMLESSGGKNLNHALNSGGDLNQAYGPVGLKYKTAHDEYRKSKHLQKLFPDLHNEQKFMEAMKTSPNLYNSVAASHWNNLKNTLKTPARAAFGWRHGKGAAINATEDQVNSDPYVQKFSQLSGQTGGTSKKSGRLGKSEVDETGKLIAKLSSVKPGQVYNYDNVLTPQQIAEGYSIRVTDMGNRIQSCLYHGSAVVGHLDAIYNGNDLLKDKLMVDDAYLGGPDASTGHPGHRGKGLGQALYEALYEYGSKMGVVKYVVGGSYSNMASDLHQKLAEKHGLQHVPQVPGTEKDVALVYPNRGVVPTSQRDAKYDFDKFYGGLDTIC